MFKEGDMAKIDLSADRVRNMVTGNTIKANPLPEKLISIIEAGGLIPLLKKEGYM